MSKDAKTATTIPRKKAADKVLETPPAITSTDNDEQTLVAYRDVIDINMKIEKYLKLQRDCIENLAIE